MKNASKEAKFGPKIVGKGFVVVIAVISFTCFAGISAVALFGGTTSQVSVPSKKVEPTYSLMTTNSPSPKSQTNIESGQDIQSEQPGAGGSSSNRNGAQNPPPIPNWTEAQRACQAQMDGMAAESNRVARVAKEINDAYNALRIQIETAYGSNPWSTEDLARVEQARLASDSAYADVTAFWAQYPWQQWGCDENGMWHVP